MFLFFLVLFFAFTDSFGMWRSGPRGRSFPDNPNQASLFAQQKPYGKLKGLNKIAFNTQMVSIFQTSYSPFGQAHPTTTNSESKSQEGVGTLVELQAAPKPNLKSEHQLSVKSNNVSLESFIFAFVNENKQDLLQSGINLAAHLIPYGHIVSNVAPTVIQVFTQLVTINKYKEEIQMLTISVAKLNKELMIGKHDQAALKKSCKNLRTKNKILTIVSKNLEKTKKRDKRLKNIVEKQKTLIQNKENENQQLTTQMMVKDTILQENKIKLQDAEKKINDLNTQLKDLEEKQKTDLLNKHQEFEAAKQQLQEEITKQNNFLTTLQTKHDKLTTAFNETTSREVKAKEEVKRFQQELERELKQKFENNALITRLTQDNVNLRDALNRMEEEKGLSADEIKAREIADTEKDAKLSMQDTLLAGGKLLLLLQIVRWSYDYNHEFAYIISYVLLAMYVPKATKQYHSITETYKKHETTINFAAYTIKLLLKPILISLSNDFVDAEAFFGESTDSVPTSF